MLWQTHSVGMVHETIDDCYVITEFFKFSFLNARIIFVSMCVCVCVWKTLLNWKFLMKIWIFCVCIWLKLVFLHKIPTLHIFEKFAIRQIKFLCSCFQNIRSKDSSSADGWDSCIAEEKKDLNFVENFYEKLYLFAIKN